MPSEWKSGSIKANITNIELGKNTTAQALSQKYKEYIQIYDLSSRFVETLLNGRVPAVKFKIKNTGSLTVTELSVLVKFLDKSHKAIHEDTYHPIMANSYLSKSSSPLRPNYIWTNGKDSYYLGKNVPDEWKVGSVKIQVSKISFADSQN